MREEKHLIDEHAQLQCDHASILDGDKDVAKDVNDAIQVDTNDDRHEYNE